MKLFIGNLSFDSTEQDLRQLLEPFEPILEYIRPVNHETGEPRGFAFVSLMDREKGAAAIEALDGAELGGRKLKVDEARERARVSRPHSPKSFRDDWEDDRDRSKPKGDDRPVGKDGKKVVYKSI